MSQAARNWVLAAIGAGALGLAAAWWLFRPTSPDAPATEAKSSTSDPRSGSVAVAPGTRPLARRPSLSPPRFVPQPVTKAPAATKAPALVSQDGREVVREDPKLRDAVAAAAHGPGVTMEEFRAGVGCLRAYGERRPDAIDATGILRGVCAITVETKGEQSRVVKMTGMGQEDSEFFNCLRRSRVWLSGKPFPAPGVKDGTAKVEWPYRLVTRGSAPPPPPG
jgi:hypothetical protein